LRVSIRPDTVTYSVEGTEPLDIDHCSGTDEQTVTLRPGEDVELPWEPVVPLTDPPEQPAGREPLRWRSAGQ
jgi:hypothetical protein